MKKSKRIAALIAAVLMTVTMFTGAISAYAKTTNANIAVSPKGLYSNLIVTGWHSKDSNTKMYAQTTANYSTYRLAVTMIAKNVDSKGNIAKTGGNPDISKDYTSATPEANITSGTGNKFVNIYILYAGLTDDNVNHCASTVYQKTF